MTFIHQTLLPAFAAIALVVGSAHGHQDPRGDIHPQVSVVDGRFTITFSSSQPDQRSGFIDRKPLYRTIFEKDGKVFAPRHPLKATRGLGESGPAGLYGRTIQLGESTIIFNQVDSTPRSYLLRDKQGKMSRIRIPWPKDLKMGLFEDVTATKDGIAMTGKEDALNLKFYWLAHDSVEAPKELMIGPTACIYDFPVASNITFENLSPVATWLGKPGDPAKGGLSIAEYQRRQEAFRR